MATEAKYQPNELQTLKLQLAQRDAMMAQKDLFIAQQNLQVALKNLQDQADEVRVTNGWPKDIIFNPDKLSFFDAPKPIAINEGAK